MGQVAYVVIPSVKELKLTSFFIVGNDFGKLRSFNTTLNNSRSLCVAANVRYSSWKISKKKQRKIYIVSFNCALLVAVIPAINKGIVRKKKLPSLYNY